MLERALPCSQQLLSSSTGHNGDHVYCELRPRPESLLRLLHLQEAKTPDLFSGLPLFFFCLFVLLPEDLCLAAPSSLFPGCWLVSYSMSQSLERSRSMLPDIWCLPLRHKRTSGLEPAQFLLIKTRKWSKPRQTSAKSAQLNVCLWEDSGIERSAQASMLFLTGMRRVACTYLSMEQLDY